MLRQWQEHLGFCLEYEGVKSPSLKWLSLKKDQIEGEDTEFGFEKASLKCLGKV